MKLSPDNPTGQYKVTRCSNDTVEVSGNIYKGNNIIIGKDLLLVDQLGNTAELTDEKEWKLLWQQQPEIVIIGTTQPIAVLANKLQPLFYSRGIGLEIMSSPAACRTLTVLLAEHRHVFAALFLK